MRHKCRAKRTRESALSFSNRKEKPPWEPNAGDETDAGWREARGGEFTCCGDNANKGFWTALPNCLLAERWVGGDIRELVGLPGKSLAAVNN